MRKFALCAVTLLLVCSISASADTVITYVSGPATLDSYNTTTAGASATPWTIGETFTGVSGLVLELSSNTGGSPVGPDNSTGTIHSAGKWFSKTVTNNTGVAWTSFEIELQSVLGVPSTDGDGLSFAQGGGLTFTSDKFSDLTKLEITRDYLNFSNGTVGIGESVTFLFAITDIANNPFWLLETPNKADVLPGVPEPCTMLLLGSGASLFGYLRKRKA
jgi:hypothetical protein